MSKTVLLTGGAGFIGHHTVEHILINTDWNVVILDRLSYAGNLNALTSIECWSKESARVRFVYHHLAAAISDTTARMIGSPDYIIHMAAESHVDRSITDPMPFVMSNVVGTANMLEYANKTGCEKFLYISTDEVYGAAINGRLHKEGEPHLPSNPYSASKSGAEALCRAYFNSYELPIMISNTMNNFGERQNAEKFVPRTLLSMICGKPVVLHCKRVNGEVVDISSRCWLHARNHADGILFLLEKGMPGESYNIVGELRNVFEMADLISQAAKCGYQPVFEDFHSFRKGHDMHYGLDGTKMSEMGWRAPVDFIDSLNKTIRWTLDHPEWLSL